VLGVAVELHPRNQRLELAVDPRLGEAVLHRLLEQFAVYPLSAAHDGREQRDLLGSKAALQVADQLRRRTRRDRDLAIHAVQHPDARPNQTEVV
jgi:hypothetical protein